MVDRDVIGELKTVLKRRLERLQLLKGKGYKFGAQESVLHVRRVALW